jgi:hypothetical protein
VLPRSPMTILRTLPFLVLLAGCEDVGRADVALLPEMVDYRSNGAFTRVNATPYVSDLDSSASIDVWISTPEAADYARVDPGVAGSRVHLADGTVIIREVHDGVSGQLGRLTIMVKGNPGHAPEVGDWWFAVTDENGIPVEDETGRRLAGDLQECYGCHQARGVDDDFLFGVPASVR